MKGQSPSNKSSKESFIKASILAMREEKVLVEELSVIRFRVKSKSTILMLLYMKVKSSLSKFVDMSKAIKKTIRMEGKTLTKRIRIMKRIRTTKTKQEKNMFKLKRKEIMMKRKRKNKQRIKLMKVNFHLFKRSNKILHL